MFILMRYTNTNTTSSVHPVARRMGVFHTRKGAYKTMTYLQKTGTVPALFKIERECYYGTRVFYNTLIQAYRDWQNYRYTKLSNKVARLQYKLNIMKRNKK